MTGNINLNWKSMKICESNGYKTTEQLIYFPLKLDVKVLLLIEPLSPAKNKIYQEAPRSSRSYICKDQEFPHLEMKLTKPCGMISYYLHSLG